MPRGQAGEKILSRNARPMAAPVIF